MPQASAPQFTFEGGRLILTSPTQGTQIYYTTDGSQPTSSSNLYTQPFTPGITTKCVASGEGYLDSVAITCTLTPYGRMFTDVGAGQWFYPSVSEAVRLGLMDGMAEYQFSPNTALTRAQAAQILYNLEGQPTPAQGSSFPDVIGHWAASAIAWASQNRVVSGYNNGTFCPEQGVTRQELAQMLYNYSSYKGRDLNARGDLSLFPDRGKIQGWALDAMGWAVGEGLFTGHGSGALDPESTATRGQAASLLTKFHQTLRR